MVDADGVETISRGCKPIDECPAGAMTDIIPSPSSEDGEDGSVTYLNCNYFEDQPDDETPQWHLCDDPGMFGYMEWPYQQWHNVTSQHWKTKWG